ncbi:MAG TPA: ABC transporter ATP-binding protein [Chloroflexota bacterium]|nr:ABC transporter ATP-binding protein [Chloroflexota bacterium]
MTENEDLVRVQGLTRRFGGLTAVDSLDFEVRAGEILSLIGPNGAGKTTVFNIISGIYPPTSGQILFKGENIAGLKPDRVQRKGISRTFQTLRLFANMSVLENVLVGYHSRLHSNLFGDIVKPPWVVKAEKEAVERSREVLGRLSPRLLSRQEFRASDLAYADRRLLELARALVSDPALLLLDEPTAGMNPTEAAEFMDHIRHIHADGFTILLIEHNLNVVMGVSHRIVVLDYGTKIAEGTPDEVRSNERVIEAYLGRKAASA